MFTKILSFLKRPRNFILTGIAAVILVSIFVVLARGRSGDTFRTATVSAVAIQQEISVTGRVQPSKKVELSFETPGRISSIAAKISQNVFAGQFLMSLDLGELNAQKMIGQANVNVAQIKLDQLISGARSEDIAVFQTSFENSKEGLINSSRAGLDAAKNSMITLTDAQYAYFNNNHYDSIKIKDAKEAVLYKIYGQPYLGGIATFYFSQLSDVMTPKIDRAERSADYSNVLAVSGEIKEILLKSQDALGIIYNVMENSPEKTNIGAAKTNILNQISTLTSAQSAFKNAQDQLNLKKAPATQFDIEIAKSQLDQAKANLAVIQAQINKRVIVAPISGVVTEINGEIGEMSSSGKPAVSLISSSRYEVEAQIPEADIASAKIGNEAIITVDAYGPDVSWTARVVQIYPSEQIIDGVATYKTVLQFGKGDDRIRSGMTANIDIISAKKDGVLAIPQRAVIRKNGSKFVKILVEKNDDSAKQFANLTSVFENKKQAVYEVPIETGIKGSDGKIEIISGLKAGEKIIVE